MRKLLLTFFLISIYVIAYAQSGTITGSVTNALGEPVGYASIAVKGTSTGTQSDDRGYFTLSNLSSGKQTIQISAVGYQRFEREVVVKSGETISLDVILSEKITNLQTVEIIGRKERGYANSTSFLATKTSSALQDVPQSLSYVTKELALDQAAFRLNDVVKNISGVNQFSFYNDITIRGYRVSGQRNSGMLVNGMRAFTSFWKQQLIPHIERVEVIKGPASALFGNASPGGTINRVTKKPLAEQRQSISATVGSFNTFRTVGDFTGSMSKDQTLLYRLNLGYENSGNFRDLQFDKNIIVAPSFSFRPNNRTNLNFDIVYQGPEGRLDRGHAVFGNGDLFSVPITRALNAANDFLEEESINATISLRHQLTEISHLIASI